MENIINLENKTILVSGASAGIGRAISVKLAGVGAKVIMIARRPEAQGSPFQVLQEKHKYYQFDLMQTDKIADLVKRIVEENGRLDGFVHSAGIGGLRLLNSINIEHMQNIMTINFYAFMELAKAYAKKKNNNGGSIVAISSYAAIDGQEAQSAYTASKSAVNGAVKVLAKELKKKGIRVNSICPAWVQTEMMESYLKSVGKDTAERSFNKPGLGVVTPEEIANIAAFLLSQASSAISGTSIIANANG